MERYTIFFITVNALHGSGGFSAHHQEPKNCTHSIGYMPSLLAATASASNKQAWHIPDAVCTVLSSWRRAKKPPGTCRALTVIKNDIWYMIYDIWYVIYDMWYMICDVVLCCVVLCCIILYYIILYYIILYYIILVFHCLTCPHGDHKDLTFTLTFTVLWELYNT
jgi:hypothetical protein